MLTELKKDRMVYRVITTAVAIVSALLQMSMIQAFIRSISLLSGGFTGVAILINRTTPLYGYSFSTSSGMLTLNISVVFLRSESISMRFTFYSMMQISLTSFSLKVLHFQPTFNDVTLNVVLGGFLYGIGIVIAFRGSASTDDTDFIALHVPNKTECSTWECVPAGNVLILCILGFIFGWIYAEYSILSQYISARTISTFHHRYERVTFQITTPKAETVIRAYIVYYRHGVSCVDIVGDYNHKKTNLFHTAASPYEVPDIVVLMRGEDPHVTVNMIEMENLYEGFYQAPME